MATAATLDECKVCLEVMKTPRFLKCGHSFCLVCLETLERKKIINCPVCRKDTQIPVGLQVKHLPQMYIKKDGPSDQAEIAKIAVWNVKKLPYDLTIDEVAQVIYVSQSNNKESSIEIYSFTKDFLGSLTSDKDLSMTCLAMDTKRGILLATAKQHIVSFNRKGIQTGVISCQEFKDLVNIAHYQYSDNYIVSDLEAHSIFFVDPQSNSVIRTIPAQSDTEMRAVVYIACTKTERISVWATADWYANVVKVYDSEGLVIRSFEAKGSGHGQFNMPHGIYMNKLGQLIVSDMNNNRLVHLRIDNVDDNTEWDVICNMKQYDEYGPRAIDITEDGLAVVTMYNDLIKGPYQIAILSGFDAMY